MVVKLGRATKNHWIVLLKWVNYKQQWSCKRKKKEERERERESERKREKPSSKVLPVCNPIFLPSWAVGSVNFLPMPRSSQSLSGPHTSSHILIDPHRASQVPTEPHGASQVLTDPHRALQRPCRVCLLLTKTWSPAHREVHPTGRKLILLEYYIFPVKPKLPSWNF